VCFVGRVFYSFENVLWSLQVTEEIEGMRFNTAISAMMEFINAATKVQYSDLVL
jgi:leucyl-tRNA synthetase